MASPKPATFLGIDVGTSAVKLVLIDASRRHLADASRTIASTRPQPNWSEQSAADWWLATEAAVTDLRHQAGADFARIAGIGLSGQMHGAVLLGRDDRPLHPVLLWNDGRAEAEAAELARTHPDLGRQLGVLPMAGLTAPKLLWLRRHQPALFAAIDGLLLPKDYIRLRLIGERVTDMSDAAGTWLFDQASRTWSAAAAEAVGLPMSVLPRLVEGSAISGRIRADMARAWGLEASVIVAGGGGDAAAGAVGIGAISDGDSFVSLGTSCQLVRVGADYRPNVTALVHAFAHAVPQRWYQMGAMLNGASVMGWAARLTGRDVADLDRAAAHGFRGPSDLLMLPYLSGERTPHNDPHARGVIFGCSSETTAETIAQAAMEGVAFSLADAAQAIGADNSGAIGLVGGGARSDLWARIIAAVLDRPVLRYAGGDKGAAYGAALLAQMAVTGDAVAAIASTPPIADITTPDPRLVEAYQPRLAAFRWLYAAVRAEFR